MKRKEKTETLGDRLKILRDSYLLTQADLAAKVGVSTLTISNIERGVAQNPYPDTIKNIAAALNSTYDWLSEGKGEMLPDGKKDLASPVEPSADPWKDEAYSTLKTQNERLWDMVQRFMSGDVSFLHPVKETA